MDDVTYADGERDESGCRHVDGGGINADTATCLLLPILPWSMAIIAAMKRRSMLIVGCVCFVVWEASRVDLVQK